MTETPRLDATGVRLVNSQRRRRPSRASSRQRQREPELALDVRIVLKRVVEQPLALDVRFVQLGGCLALRLRVWVPGWPCVVLERLMERVRLTELVCELDALAVWLRLVLIVRVVIVRALSPPSMQ